MAAHREAVLRHAQAHALIMPDVFLDNGCPSSGPMPELERLLELVAVGGYQTVIVPGPFVFSLSDSAAEAVVQQIEAHGCQVVEISPAGRPSERPRASAGRPMHSGRSADSAGTAGQGRW